MTESDLNYQDRIDQWVRERLDGKCVHTWRQLVRSLPGVDPALILESIRRNKLSVLVNVASGFDDVCPPARTSVNIDTAGWSALPTPHPLDYCWWFDGATIHELALAVARFSAPDAHVVLLGTPTLLEALTARYDTRTFSLIDADPLAVGRFSAGSSHSSLLADLLYEEVHPRPATFVIADPPWYPSEMRAFLWAARRTCDADGRILMSVPAEGTRPGIGEELDSLMTWATSLGLAVEDFQRAAITYVSSLFEQNALFAGSIPAPGAAWRRGDAILFRCVGPCIAERPQPIETKRWHERVFGDVRIRVRDNGSRNGWVDPSLINIAESDVLPTVSRRDHRRNLVDVWTCGNRVFRCDGKAVLLAILDAMSVDGGNTLRSVEQSIGRRLTLSEAEKIEQTEERLHGIIETEGREVSIWRQRHARVDVVTA